MTFTMFLIHKKKIFLIIIYFIIVLVDIANMFSNLLKYNFLFKKKLLVIYCFLFHFIQK